MTDRLGQSGGRSEWGLASASRLIATFTDYDEPHAPYEGRAIQISVCGDVLFIYPGHLTEEKDQSVFKHGDGVIGVDAEAFYEALGTMLRREDRINHERAKEGKLPANNPAHTITTYSVALPATRRRA